ncbi:unnamed protein product [Pleuronectes platessa]|uniref:Uncharacterized protein n=1 Tax=Pleuronectes platessa TaxID=8262 RepID=A0A9N7UUI9_PLEPL|nr:unnamed protein product [Pleuronectes platessa]
MQPPGERLQRGEREMRDAGSVREEEKEGGEGGRGMKRVCVEEEVKGELAKGERRCSNYQWLKSKSLSEPPGKRQGESAGPWHSQLGGLRLTSNPVGGSGDVLNQACMVSTALHTRLSSVWHSLIGYAYSNKGMKGRKGGRPGEKGQPSSHFLPASPACPSAAQALIQVFARLHPEPRALNCQCPENHLQGRLHHQNYDV